MLELRLAGIHEDGENLVLESADGTSYLLPIDKNLRTSIAKARRIQPVRGRNGAATFGPRDIQARFRQGATVEEIVAESGWDADRVRKYEWPIIAERQHIISAARNARITDVNSRGGSPFQNSSLAQRLDRVLAAWRLDEAPQDWNTFQQESGQWTVTFEIPLTDQERSAIPVQLLMPARWTYNPANQSIYASNDAAYFFMGRTGEDHGQKQEEPSSEPELAQAPVAEQPEVAPRQSEHHVDFARHADETTEFPKTESLKAVRVPENKVQDEILEELESRRGTRDFGSASERKLADLLERARRSGHDHAAEEQTAATQNGETASETQPQAEDSGIQVVSEQSVEVEEQKTPHAVVPVATSEPEPIEEAEVIEDAPAVEETEEVETFSSRAERRNHMMQRYLDSHNASKASEPSVAEEKDAEIEQDEEDKQREQIQSERDAAGSSWRSQNQAKPSEAKPSVAESETNQQDEKVEDEASDSEVEETAEEAPKPTRSSKPKRASVPSWDDIIFGSQRK